MSKRHYFDDPAAARLARKKARPRGPNKVETDIKLMVEKALHKLGGVEYLVACGKQKRTQAAFLGLVKQIIPRNISVEAGTDLLALLSGSWQRSVPTIPTEAIVTGPEPKQIEEENGHGYRHPLASGE